MRQSQPSALKPAVRATPIDGSAGRARTRQDSYAARLPIVSAGIDRLLDS